MVYIWVVALSVLSGIFYRLGGAAKTGDMWDWLRNTKARDVGCSLITTFAIYLLHPTWQWWAFLLHFGLLWGALTMYWDFLNHGEENWFTWIVTGVFYGVAAFVFPPIWLALVRSIFIGLSTSFWRETKWLRPLEVNDAVWDEVGVGFILCISVVIL